MGDPFGHHHVRGAGVHVDFWGRGPLLLRHGNEEWWFEFSHMFGPLLLRATDLEPAKRQPAAEGHPFWKPFNTWFRKGGKRRAVRNKRGQVRFYPCHLPKDKDEVTT